MGFISGMLDLLFPPKCVFCRRVLPSGTRGSCSACRETVMSDIPPIRGGNFSRCCVAMEYGGSVRDAIIRFKFKDQPGYATEFGRILAETIRKQAKGDFDLLTWIPVSPERLKKRGYDQAMLIAMSAALELDDVAVETLRKQRHNPAQSSISDAAQRRSNVLGAYEATDPELIAGKRILLVDDIITTGSTMEEASRTLLEAGAREVIGAALAHPTQTT